MTSHESRHAAGLVFPSRPWPRFRRAISPPLGPHHDRQIGFPEGHLGARSRRPGVLTRVALQEIVRGEPPARRLLSEGGTSCPLPILPPPPRPPCWPGPPPTQQSMRSFAWRQARPTAAPRVPATPIPWSATLNPA